MYPPLMYLSAVTGCFHVFIIVSSVPLSVNVTRIITEESSQLVNILFWTSKPHDENLSFGELLDLNLLGIDFV